MYKHFFSEGLIVPKTELFIFDKQPPTMQN